MPTRLLSFSAHTLLLLLPGHVCSGQKLSLRGEACPDSSVTRSHSPLPLVLRPAAAPFSGAVLPAGAATAHYGFFCRQELKWDKALPTQLRFRVGSMESCNYLEGKGR